jgi:hypothetical protein
MALALSAMSGIEASRRTNHMLFRYIHNPQNHGTLKNMLDIILISNPLGVGCYY